MKYNCVGKFGCLYIRKGTIFNSEFIYILSRNNGRALVNPNSLLSIWIIAQFDGCMPIVTEMRRVLSIKVNMVSRQHVTYLVSLKVNSKQVLEGKEGSSEFLDKLSLILHITSCCLLCNAWWTVINTISLYFSYSFLKLLVNAI